MLATQTFTVFVPPPQLEATAPQALATPQPPQAEATAPQQLEA
jgi:hypothetical protein